MRQTSPLWAQSSQCKMLWCVSKATSSQNTFEGIFCCAKYLRVITYLLLDGYDCTDSTLTNMNEWIRERDGSHVLCRCRFFSPPLSQHKAVCVFFRHISLVPGICSMGWNINHSASLWKQNSQLFHKDWIWSLLATTAVCFDCQPVTQQSSPESAIQNPAAKQVRSSERIDQWYTHIGGVCFIIWPCLNIDFLWPPQFRHPGYETVYISIN